MTNTSSPPDVAEMGRLFAQFLASMGHATAAAKRTIPPIEKLTRQEDFPVWRENLIYNLRNHNLSRYITSNVPEPKDNDAAKEQWRRDRVEVCDYIQAAVPGHTVWSTLMGMGWCRADTDPKKTYDLLTQYFEKGSATSNYEMLRELVNIRRESFDRMDSFQERINYLRQRLENTPLKLTKEAYLWCALQAVEKEYTDLYNRAAVKMQAGTLDWGDLMAEFRQLAVTEASQPAMVVVKGGMAMGTTSKKRQGRESVWDPTTGYKGPDAVTCATCNKKTSKDYAYHCNACGWHNKGPLCWRCNPEQTPDTWRYKALWVKKKMEREALPAATTGPLHQQSGVANPNNTTDREKKTVSGTGNNKKVMFQTSNMALVAMELPDFRGGPQRI